MLTKLLLMKCLLNKGLSTNVHRLLSTQYLKTLSINLLNVIQTAVGKMSAEQRSVIKCLLSIVCHPNKCQPVVDKMSAEQRSVIKCLPSIVCHPNECQPNCC
jgi:hypothetical protein